MFETIQGAAGGNINPSRFVKPSTAADHTFLEGDANEMVIGVSTEAQRDAPVSGSSALAAEAGDPISVHPIGSVAPILVGSGGVTRGALVKSDADGKSVLALTTGTVLQWVGGIALESAADGEIARHLIVSFPYRPAIV